MAKDNRPLRLSDIARPELGEGEANPFAERHDPEPASEQQFAAGETYRTGDFETTVGHRGGFLLVLGLVGVVVAITPLVLAFFFPDDRVLLLLVQPFLGLLFGGPAWLMGRSDLKAMQVGAMDNRGRGRTRAAMIFGAIATASVFLMLLGVVTWIFASILGVNV
ncbi:hypothetical protein LOC68_01170 [Blastopirellula sp. JC732]|uniref:Uncharacterized protein n=1 Tax=Blastopirellula sediminis TaxID=2894196 RepID=A0A9X1MIS3_9BACT|nr:hypothetical protein [Blastopirellula sediminis]MCC9608202.1 hypothetical protein [Blastopirellula sediminis]MCC9627005.1 hypothetical protein [Blastopirellula sediminis]